MDPAPDVNQTAAGSLNSDRRTAHWDLKNAFRNYSTLVASQVAVAGFSFASVWLVTNQIGTAGYGGVIAVIAASQVAQIFVNWTGISLARYGVEEFVETGRITESFWARTAIFLPNTLIFLLFAWLWLPLLAGLLKLPAETIWLVAAHSVVSSIWLHVQFAMQAAKLPRLQGVLVAVERSLIFAGIVVWTALDLLDGLTAIAAYIIAPTITAIAGLIAIRRIFSWKIRVSATHVKTLLRFSIPMIPSTFIGYFSTSYLDAIFISQYLSKAELGVYSIAYQINGILMQFPLLAGSLLLPLFVTLLSRGKADRVKTYLQDVLPLFTLIGAIGGVCAAFVMQYLIRFVFGYDSADAVIIVWILVSSSAFAIPILIGFAPYINGVSATYISFIIATVSSVVNLAANYFLIPSYGIKGCAWATVFAYGSSVLVVIVILRVRFAIRHRWTVPAFLPALTASAYASATDDLVTAFILAFVVALAVLFIWRSAVADGFRMVKDFRTFAAG